MGIESNEINYKCSKEVYLIVSGVKFQIYAAFREMSGNLFHGTFGYMFLIETAVLLHDSSETFS